MFFSKLISQAKTNVINKVINWYFENYICEKQVNATKEYI